MFGRTATVEKSSMGWEIRPEGLGMVLDRLQGYGAYKRLVVTECGISFPDEPNDQGRVVDPARVRFVQQHLEQVRLAVQRGIPVDGFFYWSLMDNFEWTFGYEPRFGLVHVDFETQQRTVKDSGRWWSTQIGGELR